LPRYYYPLVAGILLLELVVLVLALLHILPLQPFHIYPIAGYYSYVAEADISHIATIITRWFFFFLTAGVLLSTMLIIVLEVIRRFIDRRDQSGKGKPFRIFQKQKPQENPSPIEARIEGDYIIRFDIHQRIQHFVLMATFIVLAITGIIRGFPDWPTMQLWTNVLGGAETLRRIHDIAAFLMVADGVYHFLYIIYGILVKRKFPFTMMPSLKDIKDSIQTFYWIFGKAKEPEYEHFSYGQKIDYWVIFWGLPVMGITGLIMMFPEFFSKYLPGVVFTVCAAAHRDEAILAIGFIIIVHMYYGHLQTIAFPINNVFLTGKMLKAKYKQWFALEYEQIMDQSDEDK